MPVTAADLKFFASTVMTDAADGGGGRSATVLQNGASGQLFPDVSSADRTTGRTRLRKFYPSLTNIDSATLLGASVAINEPPTDAATQVSLFAFGSSVTTRAQAVQALEQSSATRLLTIYTRYSNGGGARPATTIPVSWTGGGTTLTYTYDVDRLGPPEGNFVRIMPHQAGTYVKLGNHPTYVSPLAADELGGDIGTPGPGTRTITVSVALPGSGAQTGTMTLEEVFTRGIPVYGSMAVPNITASGATVAIVSTPLVRVVPYIGSGPYPTTNYGIDPAPFAASFGTVEAVRVGDLVTLWHETGTSPATASNGGTVDVGRTNLDQMAVVDANGAEIVRFLAGGPNPGASCTANLTTGVLTFVNVSGFAQPVSVRHRIAHRTTVTNVDTNDITLADATARAFPANSVLSSHLRLGDLSARAFGQFGQQAWTRVFSDVPIGNPAGRQYTGTIGITNQGGENDRWALVFTSPTAYQVFSELLGLIGTGTTTSNYAPVNPATGAPFFTLSSSGWAPSILVGSVFRFNTEGANKPVWAVQCINPSTAAGTTRMAVRMHGSV